MEIQQNQSPTSFDPKDSLRLENEALQLLAKATDLLANCPDYEATLETVANLLVSSLANWCVIDLLNESGQIERAAVTHRDAAKADMAKDMMLRYPARPSAKRGVYKVIETRKSILISHTPQALWAQRADDEEHLRLIMELGSTSYMCLPLIARGRVVGAIMLFSADRIYSEKDLETAEHLARCIALAVDNVYMFRKLRSSQGHLVQSAKLAALGVISAGIAHEINNPLAIMQGSLQNLENQLYQQDGKIPVDQWNAYAAKARRSIDRIAKIVSHVRDFSRESKHALIPVDLKKVVEHSIILFSLQFQYSKIQVDKDFSAETMEVAGDFNRLEQVLVNVLSNAKDAIELREASLEGLIRIALKNVDGKVQIEISDNGVGMNEVMTRQIFDPFFTTKEATKGTGLGLAISQEIIRDHLGHIEVHSIPGQGTRIIIEIPAYASKLSRTV